jgi:hypothetical protein
MDLNDRKAVNEAFLMNLCKRSNDDGKRMQEN